MKTRITFVAAALLLGGTANAAIVSYVGGNDYVTPPPVPGSWLGNHVIPEKKGRVGGNLWIDVDTVIDWTFIGKEAGYKNFLQFQSCNLGNQVVGAGCSSTQSKGLLDFRFWVKDTNQSVTGATNYDPNLWVNRFRTTPTVFFSIIDEFSFYIALDDGGGGPDDNHDDWVGIGRLRVAGVPEPGTMGLLGFAVLAGVAGARMRRRA